MPIPLNWKAAFKTKFCAISLNQSASLASALISQRLYRHRLIKADRYLLDLGSHIGGPTQRKLLRSNDFTREQGTPRCRPSVAKIRSRLEPSKTALLWCVRRRLDQLGRGRAAIGRDQQGDRPRVAARSASRITGTPTSSSMRYRLAGPTHYQHRARLREYQRSSGGIIHTVLGAFAGLLISKRCH